MAIGKGAYADATVFDMLNMTVLEGDKNEALKKPNCLALSKTLARKYFGNKSPIGQTVQVSNGDVTVTAVFEDMPVNSHLQLNYLLGLDDFARQVPQRMQSWGWSQFHTYIKLKPGTKEADFEVKLKQMAERHAWPVTKEHNGSYYVPLLLPIRDIHLYAYNQQHDIAVRGNAQTVYILSATAFFILLIAVLNFINLSTARAINRMKEVGVRKVVGAYRRQLIYQFISESVMIAFISLVIGGLITELILPALNNFTEKAIPTGIFLDPFNALMVLLFAVIIGIAAGAYPAFYLSSYEPSSILSSSKQGGKSGKAFLRQSLVVLQFVLSFFLITAALVVTSQHKYMRTKDMGFSKDNVVVIPMRNDLQNLEAVKNSFLNHQNVISGSLGYGLPGEAFAGDGVRDKNADKEWPISMLTVDHDYVKTLGLELIAGRDFSEDFPSDETSAFIISESAAKLFGHTNAEDAIGHELAWPRWDAPDSVKEGKVIGVVKDFHLNSLRENITPVLIHIFPFAYSTLTLKVKSEDMPSTIAHLEKTWKGLNSEWPFEYRFLDGNFDKLYKAEEKLATLFTFFTGFTIFVACLGLFGLVVYSTTQRYKEISIRKVLGADEPLLVMQLMKTYLVLLAIAFVIAVPFSYYAAHQWLQEFAFRIDITPWLFVKAALFILLLSLITVGIQSLKAARANPVSALKEQ
jgi:putative ABC transport system permease protein